MKRSAVALLTAGLLGALVLSACGGSSEDPASSPAPPPAGPPAEAEAPPPQADPPAEAAERPEEPPPPAEPPAPAEPADPPPEPVPPAPPSDPPAPPPLPEGLPEDIAGYEEWILLNAEPIPPIEGGDPHNGTKDVFTNLEADRSGDTLTYPNGTIVVKHASRPDRDFIGLVAIMRKLVGSDPGNNDWEFIEYARDAPDDAFSILASGSVCTNCHMNAAGTDYVWVHTTGAAP